MLSSVRALALCAVLVAIYAAAPPRAFAQTEGVQPLPFDIPPQPLSTALLVFARQANVQLVFGAPIGIGLKTTTLTDHNSLPEALTRLLAGTGLAWHLAGGTITIAPGSSPGTIAFDTVKVEGTPQTFPDLNGFGAGAGANGSSDPAATEGTHSFTTNGAVVASAVPLPLLQTPQTVGVITQTQIQQQGMTDVTAALAYMPGVTLNTANGIDVAFLSRGFTITRYRIDGGASFSLTNANELTSATDISEYDNIQVLRGSDGVLGGNDAPGGPLDLQRKRPLDHDQIVVDADAGSWNRLYGDIDLTGPLTPDGHLRGRAVLSLDDQDEFYAVTHQTRSHLYAVLEDDVDADTILRVGGSYGEEHDPGFDAGGLPRGSAGEDAGLPRSTCLCATWNHFDRAATEIFGVLDHRFNDDWSFSAGATTLGQAADMKNAAIAGPVHDTTFSAYTTSQFNEHAYALRAVLNGSFTALGFEQHIVAGVDYSRTNAAVTLLTTLILSINVDEFHFDPIVLDPEPPIGAIPDLNVGARQMYEEGGIFLSLLLQPVERVHVTMGVRTSFDHVTETTTVNGAAILDNLHHDGIVTPSVAVSYDIRSDVSA